jgi:dolichol-phosphate mannosyltransferase
MSSVKRGDRTNERSVLSVIIPAYNEENVIEETVSRIRRVLELAKIENEILVVNDGSTDNTLSALKRLKKLGSLRIINFSSNYGHMNAIRAGLEASIGDYILTIDADLQDPPESIPEMFTMITTSSDKDYSSDSCDVVQAYRADRKSDSFWKRKTAALYYLMVKEVTGISVIPHAADFRIMKRHVVDKLISLPEKNLVYRLLIPSLGFKVELFPIERNIRFAGDSKYTNRKMMSLAIDSVIGFTNRPLRFLALTGIFSSIVLFIGSLLTLLLYLFGNTIPGWPSLVLLILSFNAFLFAGIGLVGEYVGRIYELVQARPKKSWQEL